MKLDKIRILNYKSIKDVTINIKQISKSHTTIFVGRNGTGKSNILEAIEFLSEPEKDFNFEALKNAQNDSSNCINFYYTYTFENELEWKEVLSQKLSMPDELFSNLRILAIEKDIYLTSNSKKFKSKNNVISNNLNEAFLAKYSFRPANESSEFKYEIRFDKDLNGTEESSKFKKLTPKDFSEILNTIFEEIMQKNKLNVTKWSYSSQYLIVNTVDLNEFKEDNSISLTLKNIFKLANFKTEDEIKSKIESLLTSPKNINKLEKILENSATDYINKIWPESKVGFKFKIQNDLKLSVYVTDDADEENSFYMSDRSDGFKQFISLILSISAESNSETLKNNVIIIDEPEIHMHPSGIKYMKNELIRIGMNNYVFLATHSEFMVDATNKERHYIVTKRNNNTYIENWESNDYLPDDEILRQAFGIGIIREVLSEYNVKGDKQLEYEFLTDKALKTLYPDLFMLQESKKDLSSSLGDTSNENKLKEKAESPIMESSGVLSIKFKEIIDKTKNCFNSDKKLRAQAQER